MDDLDRLRKEYADREKRFAGDDRYSLFNTANLFLIQQRQRETLALLKQIGCIRLDTLQILEVGAGAGGVLLEYMVYGARPENLYGCDLLPGRVSQAQALLPHSHQACADGQRLPYCSDGFDLALQYTAFSSVLSQPVKANIAAEMLRVLKPGGWVLWYDFWLNPTNPHTQGIRKTEIRALFPNCRYVFRRVTLAPPLARQLAPLSWGLAYLLEKVKLLNTHYLAAVQPLPG